jgi:flagellar P-ring protein precursor FlgI
MQKAKWKTVGVRHSHFAFSILHFLFCLACIPLAGASAHGGVRIKDLTDLEGARANQIIGFGLVVGLDGTGGKSTFTQQVVVDMLQRFNVTTQILAQIRGEAVFKSGNVSAVMVTADLGPFTRKGSRIDIVVSALDDATSLFGGTLLFTPLRGADHVVYALGQGPLSVGGFNFTGPPGGGGAGFASAQKNHPTVGRIAGGAIVECEARGEILHNGQVRFLLRDPDYVTSRSIAKAINERFADTAVTLDAGSVQVFVPPGMCNDIVCFVGEIGLLEIVPDGPAKVVINERTGTIVAGNQVRVSTTAVTHGNLAIMASNQPVASQPQAFSNTGRTVVLPRSQVGVTEQGNTVHVVEQTMTVGELARALNALGASPRDLIIIFQALKQAGALHAELIVM